MDSLELGNEQTKINLYFYHLLKQLNGTTTKLYPTEEKKILEVYHQHITIGFSQLMVILKTSLLSSVNKENKKDRIISLIALIRNEDELKIFIFSIYLKGIKSIILSQINSPINLLTNIDHPLSIAYDINESTSAYSYRVKGALSSLSLFKILEKGDLDRLTFLDKDAIKKTLYDLYVSIQLLGIESNQIFMLLLTESMNQSIKSTAGSSYEQRVKSVLLTGGIEDIQKSHEEGHTDTEYDFLFSIDNTSYGISAKRTLRERYKQFTKTGKESVNIMIQVTLGIDVTIQKAKNITDNGVFLFISDEIYSSNIFFKNNPMIFPGTKLNISVLKTLNTKSPKK